MAKGRRQKVKVKRHPSSPLRMAEGRSEKNFLTRMRQGVV